uniref:Uncharacterized protein n=1 Tax=viral metagenome TaxID=1070528 RepID=A0A6C0ATH2_9ZZZZ
MSKSCFINDVKQSEFGRLCEPVGGVIGLLKSLIDKSQNEILDILANSAKITMLTCHDNGAGAKVNDETFFHLLAKYYARGWGRLPLKAFINTNTIDKQVLETVKYLYNAFTNNGEPKKYDELSENAKKFINRLKTETIDGEEILNYKRCSTLGDRHTILELAIAELPKAQRENDADNVERIEKYIKVIEALEFLVKHVDENESAIDSHTEPLTESTKSTSSKSNISDITEGDYASVKKNVDKKPDERTLQKIEKLLDLLLWLLESPLMPKIIKDKMNESSNINVHGSEMMGLINVEIQRLKDDRRNTNTYETTQTIVRLRLLKAVIYVLKLLEQGETYENAHKEFKQKLSTDEEYRLGSFYDDILIVKQEGETDIPLVHNSTTFSKLYSSFTGKKLTVNTILGGKRKTKCHRRKTIRRKKRITRRR